MLLPKLIADSDFQGQMTWEICSSFNRDFEKDVNKVRDIGLSKKLNPELKPFNQWLAENANRIPLD
jgi:hypothetical protein